MKPWQKTAALGLGIPAALALSSFIGYAIVTHASDDDREKRLSDVERLAVSLGDRAEDEDAAEAEVRKLCNAGAISRCAVCFDVGIVPEHCKK